MTHEDYYIWGFIILVAVAAFAIGFVAGIQHERARAFREDEHDHEVP